MRALRFPFFSTSLSLLVVCGRSTPVTNGWTAAGRDIHGRDIVASEEDLENFKLYSQWAGSAYCNDDSSPGTVITCSSDVCPDIEAHNATVVGSFSDETITGMEGYVGIDTVQSNIVVALRGSGSVRNWIADVNIFLSSCSDLAEDCKVHAGFKKAWDNIAEDTISLVKSAHDVNPDYRIVVTGHSLGAGVANIAAAYLRVNGLPCDLYTYGSPRAGNEQFASFVSGQAEGNEYRITHTDDPFTRLPPNSWILGSYRHVTPEYWLTQVNGSADALVSDITVCEGTNNDDCNSGTDGFDTLAHLWYFGGIAGCAPASITL